MSDGILDGIFHIVHRTFLLRYFVILEAAGSCVCAQNMWTYNEAAIELAAAVFSNEYSSMATDEFRDETKLLAKKML